MYDFSKVAFLKSVVFFSFSCSGNYVTTLPEQHNDVTGALVVVINAPYDERMHDDGLKTTYRS